MEVVLLVTLFPLLCVVCVCLVWWAESDSSAFLFCLCGSPAIAVTLETRSNYSLPECEKEFIFRLQSHAHRVLFIYVPKSSLDTEVSAPVLADWFSNSGLQIGFVQQLEHHFFPPVARSVVES